MNMNNIMAMNMKEQKCTVFYLIPLATITYKKFIIILSNHCLHLMHEIRQSVDMFDLKFNCQ